MNRNVRSAVVLGSALVSIAALPAPFEEAALLHKAANLLERRVVP